MTSQLSRVLNARSIAVIGASNDPVKRGYQAVKQLLSDGFGGPIYPINPKVPEVLGLKTHASVRDVDGPIDAALVCTPARTLPALLAACGDKGIAGVVVLAAGFSETGAEGAVLAEEVLAAARASGVRVIGPNTNGVFNLHNNMNLVGLKGVKPGPVGLISQSGNMSLAFATEAERRGGAGFSTYVGVGNQLDVDLSEYLAHCGEDSNTRAVVLYAEGFRDGPRFLRTCRAVTARKPVVIFKSGRSVAGQAAAASHTGALASSYALADGVLRQAGAIVLRDSDKVLSVAEGLARMPLPGGERVAVLTDGGGHGTITADLLVEAGLSLADLSDRTTHRLAELLPATASRANPVDVAGGTDGDPSVFVDCVDILLKDKGVDMLMLVGMFGGYAERFAEGLRAAEVETSRRIGALARQSGKPVLVQSVYAARRTEPLEVLKSTGVTVFDWPEPAVRTVAALAQYARARRRLSTSMPVLPGIRRDTGGALLARVMAERRSALLEHEAMALLAAHGIETPAQVVMKSAADAAGVAASFGDAPLALKIVSRDILHKSDAGGVLLNVSGEAAIGTAFGAVMANARAHDPRATIDGVLATPMARKGVEVILGVFHDQTFGAAMMFGLGGVLVELLKDVSFRALPIGPADAREMVDEIRGRALLDGMRGAAAVDLGALVDLILRLSVLAQSHPEIAEIDLNPVILRPDGLTIVDARMILRQE